MSETETEIVTDLRCPKCGATDGIQHSRYVEVFDDVQASEFDEYGNAAVHKANFGAVERSATKPRGRESGWYCYKCDRYFDAPERAEEVDDERLEYVELEVDSD